MSRRFGRVEREIIDRQSLGGGHGFEEEMPCQGPGWVEAQESTTSRGDDIKRRCRCSGIDLD